MRFLYEINTGKQRWGVMPQGARERLRKIWGERRRNTTVRENGVGKWQGLILTVGLNQQHLRMFAEGVNQIEQ